MREKCSEKGRAMANRSYSRQYRTKTATLYPQGPRPRRKKAGKEKQKKKKDGPWWEGSGSDHPQQRTPSLTTDTPQLEAAPPKG